MRPRPLAALLAIALLAGCAAPPADGPDPGARAPDDGPAPCPPQASRGLDFPLAVRADPVPTDAEPGTVARADELANGTGPALAWTWQQVRPGEAADRLLRIGTFSLHRETPDHHWLCGSASLAAPTADAPAETEPRTPKLVIEGRGEPLPKGNYTLVVDWALAEPDGRLHHGNSTGTTILA